MILNWIDRALSWIARAKHGRGRREGADFSAPGDGAGRDRAGDDRTDEAGWNDRDDRPRRNGRFRS